MKYKLTTRLGLFRYTVIIALLILAWIPAAFSQHAGKTTDTAIFGNAQCEKWYQLSVVNKGNPANIKQVMEKAKQGHPVTIAVIGGSITAGALASNFGTTAYGPLVYAWWKNKFPGAAIKFVNAGIGATNSVFGVHREERDLLVHHPDFVIIEFCANDKGEVQATESFEGMVRKLLNKNPGTAVMAVATMDNTGANWQEFHLPVCRHYQLPMISYRDAIWPEIKAGNMSWASLSPDYVHPNDTGHAIIAGLVNRYLEDVYALPVTAGSAPLSIPTPLTANGYEHAMAYNAAVLQPLSMGSWTRDTIMKGWITNKKGKPLTFKVKGGYVSMMFKRTNKATGGTAYVLVDGKTRVALDADFTNGWGDYMELKQLLHERVKKTHTLAFYYNDNRPGKEFAITDILVANY